ncbi:MAG: phage recombination protein Bet [Alphaproteobacteria bacterium]|nr:phage recombination protein Bet [Alphaproteobacteria bacterium]
MSNITPFVPRLPMPEGIESEYQMDRAKWRVLVEQIFPAAKTAEAIRLALDYCHVRGLDIFKRPVHIVPMWNAAIGKKVETIWPGINEVVTTAARTRAFAGIDAPVFGPEVTETFQGESKDKSNRASKVEVTVTYPIWCERTVYRLVGGTRYPFTERIYWKEAYAEGEGGIPNKTWARKAFQQIAKCAKAAALRLAFPEEAADYCAEEMEGKEVTSAIAAEAMAGTVIDGIVGKPAQRDHEPEKKDDDQWMIVNPETGEVIDTRLPVPDEVIAQAPQKLLERISKTVGQAVIDGNWAACSQVFHERYGKPESFRCLWVALNTLADAQRKPQQHRRQA